MATRVTRAQPATAAVKPAAVVPELLSVEVLKKTWGPLGNTWEAGAKIRIARELAAKLIMKGLAREC